MTQLATRPSAVRSTIADPFYRGATIAMLLSGIGVSAAAPQIATFLVTDLHTSLATAGLFYLTNLLAPVAGYLIGASSDRTGNRLGLFRWCALAGGVGWIAISFSPAAWVPFVISALLLGFAGAAGSQVFAELHDRLLINGTSNPDGVVAVIRMALTAGWVVGPVLGSFSASIFGLRPMLLGTGVCIIAQMIPFGLQRSIATTRETHGLQDSGLPAGVLGEDPAAGIGVDTGASPKVAAKMRVREMLPLLAFTGLYVLVYAGESVKYAYLPLYMVENLHLSAALRGTIIGIQPLIELCLMPFSIIVARRIGPGPLMAIGAFFGVLANVLFAFSGNAAGLLAGQVLMGGVWGIFAAISIIVAQKLVPDAVATASAIFMSSTALSQALGGVLGGVGSTIIGLPHVFVIPGTLAFIAAFGLFAMRKRFATFERQEAPVDALPSNART
jgi:SET family sugar efflux transporter-like MFS transporter